MTIVSRSPSVSSSEISPFAGLAPLVLVVFFGFLAVGAPLAALPLEVGGRLGFGPAIVGCLIGLQSLVTVVTRHRAGTLCDLRGPRTAVVLGLPLAAISGLFYALPAIARLDRNSTLAVLALGRVTMGFGESLFITGTMSWGIARIGAARTGKVMSWQGIAMYASLGLGAPLGLAVQGAFGFACVAAIALVGPLLALGIAWSLPPVAPAGGERVPFHRVLGLIWRPGLILALAAVPFAAMATFLSLDFAARGWEHAGLALFGFGAAYIVVRLVASDLPDRFGAAPVAAGSLAIQALGQVLLWQAPVPGVALLGCVLSGLGFSLVFPAMGVLATKSVAPGQRGRAVGNFIAFFDVAIGVTGPMVGLVTERFGFATAFLVGAVATGVALCLLASVRHLQGDIGHAG